MFTLQIQCATLDEAERIIAALKYSADPAIVENLADQIPAADAPTDADDRASTQAPQQEPKKRGRPRREVAEKPAAPSVEQGSAPAPGSEPEVKAQRALTESDIREALKGVQAKYGEADMAKALAVLSEFNAGRISEVKPADYARFIAACEAA